MNNKKLITLALIVGFAGFLSISYIGYSYLDSKYSEKSIENKTEISQNKNFKSSIKREKSMAKDFVVYDENLNKVKLSDYIGRPVVVNFWASWCPPCKAEMPLFNELSNKYKGEELTVLMVDLPDGDRETMDKAKQFIEDNNYSMKILFDNDGNAATNYNISSIPRTLFIDKDGYIVEDHSGQITKGELENQIKSLLSD